MHRQIQQSLTRRPHVHTMSGLNAAPATTGTIKSAFTSATWILSGSIRQGEASDDFKNGQEYSGKAEGLNRAAGTFCLNAFHFPFPVNSCLLASVAPCLAAAAGQLTGVCAVTQPTGPAPAFAAKGERSPFRHLLTRT